MTSGHLRRACTRLVTAGLTAALLTTITPGTASADEGDEADDRRIVRYTVRSGDTATELAVRFHAWTDELIGINGLGSSGAMYVGQRIRIPVVVSAARKAERKAERTAARTPARTTPERAERPARRTHRPADPGRDAVRRVIVRTARAHDVDPELALAVSWQEAGWRMHHVSSANAIGAMQVLPDTALWMSMYAGRPLHLRRLQDNVLAGVLLLDVLDRMTGSRRHQLAAYYQGIGAVREHGLYPDSRRYVANVLAIKRRLEDGRPPA